MDYSRIRSAVAVDVLADKLVEIIGLGAAADLAVDLLRLGVRRFRLRDPQTVGPENLARQGFSAGDLGLFKVEAAARRLRAIDPTVEVSVSTADFTTYSAADIRREFAGVDLLILATDAFAAQAQGNQVALLRNIPAVWIGLYEQGLGGEIVFWHPQLMACFRCLCAKRYELNQRAKNEARSLDPASAGVTVADVHLVDAIAAQLAIGLLTRGSATRYGRLIDALGDRNFIQVKIDPAFCFGSRDVVREVLGVPSDNEAFFAWNTIVRRDPDRGQLYCDDCHRLRGHQFVVHGQGSRRVVPTADREVRSWNS